MLHKNIYCYHKKYVLPKIFLTILQFDFFLVYFTKVLLKKSNKCF